MPRVTIYIRNEDMEIWEAIPKKPEWLHAQLERYGQTSTRKIKLPQFDKEITVPSHKGMCKNGHITDDFGYCLAKECKYSK